MPALNTQNCQQCLHKVAYMCKLIPEDLSCPVLLWVSNLVFLKKQSIMGLPVNVPADAVSKAICCSTGKSNSIRWRLNWFLNT